MVANFIPDQLHVSKVEIPFFEDQSKAKIPGRGTEKSCEALQKEIRELLAKLDAFNVVFTPGTFADQPKRYGYRLTFRYSDIPGRLEIAALPIQSETAHKKDRALAQALYLVRCWLEAEVFSQVYRPGAVPLVPYLIGNGDKTVAESLIESGALPMLVAGAK